MSLQAPRMPNMHAGRSAMSPEEQLLHELDDWSAPPSPELLVRIERFMYLVSKSDKTDTKIKGTRPFWWITELANKVFGFNGWSIEMVSNEITKTEAPHANGPYTVEASAEIKIIFPGGTFHRGFGTGQFTNSPLKSEAIKKAKKEAVTAATKAALLSLDQLATGDALIDADYSTVALIQDIKQEQE